METSQRPVDRGVHPLQWQRESHRETTFKYVVYLQANLAQNFNGKEKIRQRNKRNIHMVSFKELLCISCVSLSLYLVKKLTTKLTVSP